MSEHNFEEIKKNIYKQPIEQLKDDIDRRKNIDKNVKLHVATLVT